MIKQLISGVILLVGGVMVAAGLAEGMTVICLAIIIGYMKVGK